jgi:ligand-binding sensor domain-containing protein
VRSLEIDQSGTLWAAVNKKGVYQLIKDQWKQHEESSNELSHLFKSIGIIRKDPKNGVWLMSDSDVQSHGILHTDGHTTTLYNPPDRILKAPTGLSVDPIGNVWIGTAFDGMFRLQRTVH